MVFSKVSSEPLEMCMYSFNQNVKEAAVCKMVRCSSKRSIDQRGESSG